MKSATDYVPRRAEELVSEALSDTRVVIINGARQVGKSTLAERVLHKAPRVKSAQSVRSEDLAGLRYLKQKLGSRMHAGYVLYCGTESLRFGDGLGCLPISSLWATG